MFSTNKVLSSIYGKVGVHLGSISMCQSTLREEYLAQKLYFFSYYSKLTNHHWKVYHYKLNLIGLQTWGDMWSCNAMIWKIKILYLGYRCLAPKAYVWYCSKRQFSHIKASFQFNKIWNTCWSTHL